ncbi:MAG: hypothetical protein ABMA15_10535 [Vicinamibacterales bacterium]
MATPSVPLSMLLMKDVPYEWHDGVALVAQLIEQVRPIGLAPAAATIPDLSNVALEVTGWLTIPSDPDQALPAMPGVVQTLQQLLSGTDQPPQLRLFVMQAASSDSTSSLEAFADELSKWERPNRMPKLVALHARALAIIGPAALTEEALARQKLRASKLATREAARGASTLRSTLTKQRMPATSIAIGAVIIAAAAGVAALEWRYVLGRSVAPAPPPRVTVVDDTPPPADPAPAGAPPRPAARASGSRVTPTPPAVPEAALPAVPVATAEAELARAQDLFDQQDYATARAAFERVLQSLGTNSSAQAEEIRQAARNLDEVARAAVDTAAVNAAQEYRSGDPGVVAPIPEAYLPPKPDPRTPPEQLQVMEVRINAQGLVDSAKFVINRPTYRNAWWPAAAKAWKFKPATKDGRAVRYVMRIVMDDSDSAR